MNAFRILLAGDSALVVEFEERIDPEVNARAIALADALQSAGLAGVRDVVPTFRSVAVYFDPLHTGGDALIARVGTEAARASSAAHATRPPVRIPVCYGGELGPDLGDVAAFANMDEAAVVAAHTARTYRV
ncbi:MAG TPA: carboxyltransferase domain-containing protein, partial [Vicinamibacterales bacterium]|nr:carboxyltransferase domain-containing protein [Vicinamibacterales bacterium]